MLFHIGQRRGDGIVIGLDQAVVTADQRLQGDFWGYKRSSPARRGDYILAHGLDRCQVGVVVGSEGRTDPIELAMRDHGDSGEGDYRVNPQTRDFWGADSLTSDGGSIDRWLLNYSMPFDVWIAPEIETQRADSTNPAVFL